MRVRLLKALAGALLVSGALALDSAGPALASGCPNEPLRVTQGDTYLPECRGFELVSPAAKNEEEVGLPEAEAQQIAFQASAGTPAIAFFADGALPGSESGGKNTQYVANGGAAGEPWNYVGLNPESRFEPDWLGEGSTGQVQSWGPDIECGVVMTELPLAPHQGEAPELAPGQNAAERTHNLYRWRASDNSYRLVSNVKPENLEETPTALQEVAGVSQNCTHVIFQSEYVFLGAPKGSLYEWSEGGPMQIASLLPDGTPAQGVVELKHGAALSNLGAVSTDGSDVFFTATADAGKDKGLREVFLRERGEHTVEISASQNPAVPTDLGALFVGATKDGHRVFFMANYGLTEASSAGSEASPTTTCQESTAQIGASPAGCALYEYNTETRKLTDLSADVESVTKDKKGAEVESALGWSEDGSVVYLTATGQLDPGHGQSQEQNLAQFEAGIYRYDSSKPHEWTYVGQLFSQETGAASNQKLEQLTQIDTINSQEGLHYLTARVSANGNFLFFGTRRKTKESDGEEYENTDQRSNVPDYEGYEFDAGSGRLTCVTCNPIRTVRPTATGRGLFGPLSVFHYSENGYLTRTLQEDGSVIFNSYGPLLPQATNETSNVYKWDPPGIDGCALETGCVTILDSGTDTFPSYFVDASRDGSNLYITTDAALTPQDEDGLRDLYDVRVNGGIQPPPKTQPCSGEECLPGYTPGGKGGGGASEKNSGNGNVSTHVELTEGEGGVEGFTTAKIGIAKRSTKGSTLTLVLTVPASGRVTVSGAGLSGAKRTFTKAGHYTLKVTLAAKGRAAIRHRHKIKVRVRIVFAPAKGNASSTGATVVFR